MESYILWKYFGVVENIQGFNPLIVCSDLYALHHYNINVRYHTEVSNIYTVVVNKNILDI